MAPTIGRIVHYFPDTDEVKAAIITKVHNKEKGVVDLTVFNSHSEGYRTSVLYSEKYEKNKWSWPPRESENTK